MVDRAELLSDIPRSAGAGQDLAVRVRALFQASMSLQQKVMEMHAETIVRMAWVIHRSLEDGGKLLLCGNGGSAADAQHLAAELLVRLRPDVNRDGVPAITLALDTSSLTA